MTSPQRRYAALVGLAATSCGLGAGHLVAGVVGPSTSPAIAVGSAAIDLTPLWLKDWATSTLGTADKPVLIVGVLVVVLCLGALAGILQSRNRSGAWLLAGLAGIAALAAATRPSGGQLAVLPSSVAALVGIVGLRFVPTDGSNPAGRERAAYAGSADRRTVVAAGLLTGAGAGAAYLGTRLGAPIGATGQSLTLPAPSAPLPALPAGLGASTPGLTPLRTPVADFYRIDTAVIIPRIDVSAWRLRIDGDVDHPYEVTFDELLRMPMIEADITLNCVSNPVGGDYIGSTRWLGVRTRDVLARAGVRDTADQILSTSHDGMTISTPVAALQDDRGALLAIAMDGKPLTPTHGFPVRMITPGLYGYVGATKWLTHLTATTYAKDQAYWSTRGWAEQAEVKTQSRIDVPRDGASVPAGSELVIAGVAWSQARQGISGVEVRVDDGAWIAADLGPDVGGHYWRQWRATWTPSASGQHVITARATDGTGAIQTTTIAEPAPDGASGLHSIRVRVR